MGLPCRLTVVRALVLDGVEYLVGPGVCDRLKHSHAAAAMSRHCRGVTKTYPIADALGRLQETRILTEADVLRLIMKSQLPAAEQFEKWVFEEVLPSIRRTGSYGAPDPMKLLGDPAALRTMLLGCLDKI